ncbi:putative synaptobrevin/VAMP-like protein [Ordospora colligata]|uniref:Putative synaptobrevin/VAMP-like protein n=1 Tax=Ordospora colligata OC4 TaxID=1354746 RepID=A0A0B2UIS1_9MICR|nr:putative synaptobrevin/VAMP-like protein [Ordospora colligata OC4]KHN68865.1 putative synaptobrevin/VAMP-like protein [Ordospora colligata OC4]TBU13899.1 putative synaptobrevin/VAMP-like protein [Ordospora colligata]TBU14088.1 putative synaptobrevin/VAMP-like protein [Ordospora colligata]TBU17757.1 putative synaptobrevin/VAMP-like protein [Ordospora colligata]
MTILYTQIMRMNDYKILSGEYSPQSNSLKPGNEVVKELRDAVKSITNESKQMHTLNCSDSRFVFYLKTVSGLVIAVIGDRYASSKLESGYMEQVIGIFMKIYSDDAKATYYAFDPTIKCASDKFNRDSSYEQGMAVVKETKGALAESLNMITKRGENINNLNKLVSKMADEAKMMQKNIHRMHLKSMLNDYWIYVALAVFMMMFLYYVAY